MTRDLQFKRRPAASGITKSVVVFLHGYGADGEDLLGLADPLGPHMPDTTFIAPDAPEKCAGNPFGYQWFPIPRLDGSSEGEMLAGIEAAREDISVFLEQVLEQEGIAPENLIIFGFSQGTMMTLDVVPRFSVPIGGIVGFSGRLLDPEEFASHVKSTPPVLLVHGDQDEMVPFEHFHEAGQALEAADFDVYGHVMNNTGHSIAPDGLSVALTFMIHRLGIDAN